jgi:hypothetical protein
MAEEQKPEGKKWNMDRVRQEVYDARTKMFVVAKVLETGSLNPSEHPDWVLVIKSLLRDLTKNTQRVSELLGEDAVVEEEGDSNQQPTQ